MSNLPHPWAAYARLQARSGRNSKIDSLSWGLEEEMDLLLENPSAYKGQDARRGERLRATVARRERHRASLRKIHETDLAPLPCDPLLQFEAREALGAIEASITPAQWALVVAIAEGHEYAEISLKQCISVVAARAQIWRLRQQFAHLRPAA
jgi:hypothetical protein